MSLFFLVCKFWLRAQLRLMFDVLFFCFFKPSNAVVFYVFDQI